MEFWRRAVGVTIRRYGALELWRRRCRPVDVEVLMDRWREGERGQGGCKQREVG
jgi:hypothetical protein